MIEKGFSVNNVAFTALLNGCFRAVDVITAESLWNEMKGKGCFQMQLHLQLLFMGSVCLV